MDLSPFEISIIGSGAQRLRVSPPLHVKPALDEETGQYFVFHDPELDLHVVASTRSALYEEIMRDLLFFWTQYVEAPESTLSQAALELRHALNQRIRPEGTDAEKLADG